MSASGSKWHVPTSDELEQQGAITPATGVSPAQRRGGLRRFFRTGRFRISEDVGVNKHVGTVPTPRQPPPTFFPTASGQHTQPAPQTASSRQASQAPSEARQSPNPAPDRRSIRINQSVKDRRGLGKDR